MFPSVLNKQQPIKSRLKQRGWDERFQAKGSIPDYSPMKDKHTKSYRKILTNTKTERIDSSNTKHIETKTYFQKRVQLTDRLKNQHPVYLTHIEQFQDFLTQSKLPNFYIYYSLLPLLNEIDVNGFITKSKKLIKQNNSSYHRIMTAIKARQECLLILKKQTSNINQASLHQKSKQLKNTIKNYRSLTSNVIDQIKRWRQSLKLQQDKAVFYYDHETQNYLIKMLNDNQFIFLSNLNSYINFGQKNDPFIIVPLKKAQGKQSSQFLELLQTQKNLAYYQKYMEYLASQKAYELSLNQVVSPQKRVSKHPQIEKVYKSKSSLQKVEAYSSLKKKPLQQQEQEYNQMQRMKLRQQRLKKNQQRINAIKNVYQTYSNKINIKQAHKKQKKEKKAETDVQQKIQSLKKNSASRQSLTKQSRKKSLINDGQFQNMVKMKYQRESDKKMLRQHGLAKQSKSLSKLPKSQDKIVQNLRQIQTTLKSKLAFVNEQTKKQQSSMKKMNKSTQKFHKKTNQNLIKQLKSEIILNLEKQSQQRQLKRSKRRQEEQKAIQQIKMKMKKEMQEKLQTRKRQKLVQRQQLQKKLKQQQQRLNKQRQIELQLTLKLSKQKQLRQLQKLKRQSLQKQKKYKQQLQKEQNLRKEREQTILNQRRQKQKILQQLKKRQLKQQLQSQIREQMKSKYGENPKLHDQSDINIIRSHKQQQLAKQIQLLKIKQNSQIDQIRKQNELRERMLKLKRDQEELKRKQVQHLMKSVVQQQKQDLNRQTLKKRIQLEQQIKIGAKQKLLQQYKAQKEEVIEKNRLERERVLQEDVYRQKIKDKIQKDMRMQAIQRTKKQMDDRESRRYQMNVKMQQVRNKFNSNIQEDVMDKSKIQNQVKKELIEKVIFDKQAQRQLAKSDLRSQFERQLMASSIPQIYRSNQVDPILRKNIESYKNDDYLRDKLSSLQNQKPTNQKSHMDEIRRTQSYMMAQTMPVEEQSPTKINRSLSNATNQQLYIYSKKKNRVSQMRQQPSYKLPKKLPSQQDQGFQLMKVEKGMQQSNFDVKIIRKNDNKNKQSIEQQYQKKSSKKNKQSVDSQDSQQKQKKQQKIIKSKKKKSTKKKYQSQEQDSQDVPRHSKKIKPKRNRDSDEARSSSQDRKLKKSTKRSQKSEIRQTPLKKSDYNDIRITQSRPYEQNQQSKIKLGQSKLSMQESQQAVKKVHYDAQKPAIQNSFPDESKVTIRQTKHSAQSKYQIRLQAIPQDQLDQYLSGHFQQMPQVQRNIQLFNRQNLYRKLINQLTFCMLLGFENNIVVGIALAYHDRNKTDSRKFTIIHISTYQNQQLKDFIISSINYIFRKDPTDEIQFHYKFNQQIEEQESFSTQFNKWFDKYGNVYQKKINDFQYQRKYVLKRQFNQKCQVVLGGINKNTFRNIFSVYCGVLMSETDMVQIKEELKDAITPQNQISYAIAMAQLFRTYLSPDQAQVLKTKVKEFAKLKQLLILVVMLQKKKVKIDQMKLSEYKNLIELNMKLMSQGKDVIRYCKDGASLNRIYYAEISQAFNLPFNFQTTSLPIQAQSQGKIHQVSYFRLSPLPPNKLQIMRSSLYNSQLHILPTQNSKYKLFIINAQEYNQIKQLNHLDIFMYVRLFMKNVKSHNTASWKYVWLPEMTDKANYNIREFKSFLNKDIYCHDSINISYRQFLPNALIIEPQHRDLVITPPFIVGVMSNALQHVTEGSPLYARMIDIPALRTLQIQD